MNVIGHLITWFMYFCSKRSKKNSAKRSLPKKIILNITPQTHVRATQGDSIFFRIPRDTLRPPGLKRLKRLERYNEYKISLSALAKQEKFSFPEQGASIIFFIPVPKSWSKKKKKLHHGTLHQSKPDLDNLLKAMTDSLLSEDKIIAHYGELCKVWVNLDFGWIEISETTPSDIYISPPTQE
jgi:Holliday junction resolvase RusA-like endonuclease